MPDRIAMDDRGFLYWAWKNKLIPKSHWKNFWHGESKGSLGRNITELIEPRPLKRRKVHHKGRHRRHQVNFNFGRFRERPLPGHELGSKYQASVTKIGEFNRYINGVKTTSEPKLCSGTPSASLAWEQTWDQVNPGPPYHVGGPFREKKYHVPTADLKGSGRYTNIGAPGQNTDYRNYREYIGGFLPGSGWPGNLTIGQIQATGFSDLRDYHTRAWDQCKPRVPKAGVGQFIYELRDLPRQLESTANLMANAYKALSPFRKGYTGIVMSPDHLADDFLNHNFGWVPFISDMYKMYDTYHNLNKIISDTVAMNGQWMKRKRVLEEERTETLLNRTWSTDTDPSTSDANFAFFCEQFMYEGSLCRGYTEHYDTTHNKIWAVGSFKYYRPEFDPGLEGYDSLFANAQRLLTIYGLRVSPTLLWKITPWTWAIDWFTEAGKFIERHDDFVVDGIVSRYLYVMKSSERRITKNCFFNFHNGARPLSWSRELTTKQREVADSPYGFNVPWTTLSAKQWAILGAIGFTRTNSGFISRGA